MVVRIAAVIVIILILALLTWAGFKIAKALDDKKALDAVDRAPDPIKESEALQITLDRGVRALGVVESVLDMRKRNLGEQLEQPFYTDERVPVVRSMYIALKEAQEARPEIKSGECYSDHRDEIKDFERRTQVLATILEKAIASSDKHEISPQEEATRQEMLAEYRRRPSSSYDAQARMDTLRHLAHNLPFVHIGENMLDLDPVKDVEVEASSS